MKKTILIVDDSKPMLALLSGIFRSQYEVITKSSAVAALTHLHEGFIPDLILTDVSMPEMSGFDFVKHLKDTDFLSHIPIMVLSGIQTSSARLELFKLGIDEYLTKPFNPEELHIRAEKLIARAAKQTVFTREKVLVA